MLMSYEIIDKSKEIKDSLSTSPAVIKVIGAGGGGSNAVNRMVESGMKGVDFIAVNTDKQALNDSKATVRIAIGSKLTGGLGAGGDPDVGEKAALEDKEAITNAINGANMLFITAGMGGGTGTGAAPIIAQVAKELGILTVAVVTKPFSFEGVPRRDIALKGIEKLRKAVDAVIIIENQNLYKVSSLFKTFLEAFDVVDNILCEAVQSIYDLIYYKGKVNVDFADVKTVLSEKGNAHMGTGTGSGEGRAVAAVAAALNNPLLENNDITGATHVLINIYSDESMSLDEVTEIMNAVNERADNKANIFFGNAINENMKDSIRLTVIVTGFQPTQFYEEKKDGIHDGEDEKNDSNISTQQWEKLKDVKPPVNLGLSTRKDKMNTEANNSIGDNLNSKNFYSFKLPRSDEDLDLPTYYRNRKDGRYE